MHAIGARLHRTRQGDQIRRLLHGVQDTAMVSVKPKPEKWGSASEPNQVPASAGLSGCKTLSSNL